MKTILQASAALAMLALARAQGDSFAALPNCAKPCAANLPANCNLDVKCICADTSFISGISCCVVNACSPTDVQKTLQVAAQLCQTVNVQLPASPPNNCPSGSGSASAGGASSSAAGVGGSTQNGFPSPSASAPSGTAQSAITSMGGSGSSMSGMSGTSTSGSSTSSSQTSSSTQGSSSGGAGVNKAGGMVGVVGAAVGAFALL